MATDVSIRLGVTGERDLTAALKGVESRIKNLNAEMKAAVSSMAGMDSAEASTAKKTDILGRSVEAAKEKNRHPVPAVRQGQGKTGPAGK